MTNSVPPRALVVAPQPFFTPRGTPFSVYYRTLVCAEAGVRMDVLTYGEGQDPDIPGVRIIRIPRFRWFGPIPIGPSFYKLFLDVFIAVWMFALLCRRRYAFVHAHEEAVFLAVFFRPLFRFKLIYDMHSSLPQQLRNFQFTKRRWLIRLFEWLEDLALRRADVVITICPELAEYAVPRMPDSSRHVLIENSIFEPVRLKGVATTANSGATGAAPDWPAGRRAIVYAGTFEPYQGLSLLLEAFARLRTKEPSAFLALIGGAPPQVEQYRAEAERLGLAAADVRIAPRAPQAVARAWTQAAEVQVSPRISGSNTPLKIYEQLASGVPLVATRIPSHTQVLTDDVAYLADPTPDALADALAAALRDGRAGNPRAAAARRLYEERYARPVYERKLRAALSRVGVCAE